MASIATRPDDLSGKGEIKSMRTAAAHVRKGVAARLLQHIVQVARARGYTQLYLGPALHRLLQRRWRCMRAMAFGRARRLRVMWKIRSACSWCWSCEGQPFFL